MTDIIFCLVGPSGSGKTTVAKMLAAKGYNVIQSYTTRPPRYDGEWGHTFVEMYIDTGENIAYGKFSGHEYWASKSQYAGKGKTIYIVCPTGDKLLRETVDVKVITIFFKAAENVLRHRMLSDRRRNGTEARILHDVDVFQKVKTDWIVDADRPLPIVVNCVKNILEEY